MATLSEDYKKIIKEDGSSYSIEKSFIEIECAKADLERVKSRIDFHEKIIKEARELGYLTESENDELEQKKYAEEKNTREEKENKTVENKKYEAELENIDAVEKKTKKQG